MDKANDRPPLGNGRIVLITREHGKRISDASSTLNQPAIGGNEVKMNQYPEDYSKRWQVLLAVMTGGFMVSVNGSVVNLILPTLVKALMTDFTRVQMENTLKV